MKVYYENEQSPPGNLSIFTQKQINISVIFYFARRIRFKKKNETKDFHLNNIISKYKHLITTKA